MASGTDPGTTYTILPSSDPGVYHEDRVVVTTVSGISTTQMFRVYGAQFSPTAGTWSFQTGVSTAYATVQNPDGSIHYFTYSGATGWLTSAWQGSDNNTIYNAVDFGTTAGGSASDNTAALSSLFTAMVTATGPALGGGMARIPQYNFPVNASPGGLSVPPGPGGSGDGFGGCIIQGLGTGGQSGTNKAFHFTINDPDDVGPFIFLNCNGPHTSGGTYFNNLAFRWIDPGYYSVAPGNDTCIYLNFWNGTVRDCTFTDCPIAVNIQGLGCRVEHCTIDYGVNISTPTAVTAILLAGINCEISGPSEMKGGYILDATNATFASVGGGPVNCVHNAFRNLHIYGWNYGIDYSDINGSGIGSGTQDTLIDGCQIDIIKTAINMVPASSSDVIFDQTITNCIIDKDHNSTDGSPLIFIDSNSGINANIGPVFLVNNMIFSDVTGGSGQGGDTDYSGVAQANQYGVQIGNCEYVSIIGGQISQFGTETGDDGTANICISGNPTTVVIDSVNLLPTYNGVNAGRATGSTGSAASQYGLLITGDPTRVTVNNCPIGLVSVTGSPGNLRITNCPGYNDQNTPLNGGAAPLSALSAAACSTRYFGPSLFTWTNATPVTVHVFGVSYTANSGIIFLPSPYDTFYMSVAPLTFSWIGK